MLHMDIYKYFCSELYLLCNDIPFSPHFMIPVRNPTLCVLITFLSREIACMISEYGKTLKIVKYVCAH